MNSSSNSELNALHKKYLACVDSQLKDFLATAASSKGGDYAKEWCTTEKGEYFSFMSKHFKTEYDNILRLESNNF